MSLNVAKAVFVDELIDEISDKVKRNAGYCYTEEEYQQEFQKALKALRRHLVMIAVPNDD